ncbi:MAG: methyltransferase domain-containing protein [Cocleimonas sp.]
MKNKTDIFESCSRWYQTQSGQATLTKLDDLCAETLSEIFGYYAIETGVLSGQHSLLRHSRITNDLSLIDKTRIKNYQYKTNKKAEGDQVETLLSLISNNEQLPLATDNVDLVIGTHLLESSEDPHQVLREIDRILVPEGQCILIGFNPYALSGLGKQIRSSISRNKSAFNLRSVNRVRDWFSLLGFELLDVQYMGLRPGFSNKKLFDGLSWLEDWGGIAGPMLGKLYVMHVKKQVVAMTPHKKVWRAPAVLSGGKVVINNTAQKVRRENYSNN